MSCSAGGRRTAAWCAARSGLGPLGSLAAYLTAGARSQLVTAGGLVALVGGGVWLGRRRQYRASGAVRSGPGGALFDGDRLNLAAGAELTPAFGGATLSVNSLLSAVGDRTTGGQMRPLVKLGGEDDLFGAEGARGQIAFTLPDGPDGEARIEGVIPARNHERELAGALDGRLPKYVITDAETGDRYATRRPYEARQFARALNQLPKETVFEVHPGEAGFDDSFKPVPEALFY